MLEAYTKAVDIETFPSLEASDYYDFADIQDPKSILFNL